jgi:hypothetical protein
MAAACACACVCVFCAFVIMVVDMSQGSAGQVKAVYLLVHHELCSQ